MAPEGMLNSFENCSIGGFKKKSKKEFIKRIDAINFIHRICNIFSQKCLIGVTGLQDAGKTALVNKIWNAGDKPGYFWHTDVPKLFKITEKLTVVDVPGSNSLDYHAKTFSICGVMNNMVIVMIPFSGDVSEIHSQEIAKVFGVMKGSDSTKVILCINKCGLYLRELKEEFLPHENPADHKRKLFIVNLITHYEINKQAIPLEKDDILFTNLKFESNQDSLALGIVGVEEIKVIIRDYLVDYDI